MPDCQPSYWSEVVPQTLPHCVELCAGLTYSVGSVTTGMNPDGSCSFGWQVERSDGKEYSDSADVECGSSKTVEFSCDGGGSCVAFRLHLECKKT